eukprot:TRINITY_DN74960_c0_g1_i1.p1 TRINITY_DN74960_c0_g1~~TRINITY_DN74960_c0_g1_i1.p1  ORF type:complete len:243 (-),score=40.62 TRINITY_DN74960_c0_g1_i1:53-781(-)
MRSDSRVRLIAIMAIGAVAFPSSGASETTPGASAVLSRPLSNGAILGLQRGLRIEKKHVAQIVEDEGPVPETKSADVFPGSLRDARTEDSLLKKATDAHIPWPSSQWHDAAALGLQRSFRTTKTQAVVEDDEDVFADDLLSSVKDAAVSLMDSAREAESPSDGEDELDWLEVASLGLQRGFHVTRKSHAPVEENEVKQQPTVVAAVVEEALTTSVTSVSEPGDALAQTQRTRHLFNGTAVFV